jgi:uncharacterized CHY-type Zn-finger protein
MNIPPQIPGVCEHLLAVAQYINAHGGRAVYCGHPWSGNCRLWVYYDVVLDCESLMKKFDLPVCITIHDHRGTHDGSERGIACGQCHDALMGIHPEYAASAARPVAKIS